MPQLHLGDCLDVLREMPDCSVDAVVTDPPYGLSFMGKRWDYDVPSVDVWAECLRVLKPGGHLLAFAGTRTQHRMAVRIEDAGFEIRDMIAWVYGSGFPKSLDVSKAIDKVNGEAGRLHKFTAWMRTTGLSAKQINEATATFMGSHYLTDKSQPAIPTPDLWAKIRALCGDVPPWVDELVDRIAAEREVLGTEVRYNEASGIVSAGRDGRTLIERKITAPSTDAARQWQGWGTALKPALEPITVARKPLVGTVAENVLAHGTGALNIDGCRVSPSTNEDCSHSASVVKAHNGFDGAAFKHTERTMTPPNELGRWPANLIHDGSEGVLAGFPMQNGRVGMKQHGSGTNSVYGKFERTEMSKGHTGEKDTGSAARFFYCAKASKRDRDEGLEGFKARSPSEKTGRAQGSPGLVGDPYNKGQTANPFANGGGVSRNNHPTVKPTDLMRYLCRLITPLGGVVLDPFMGSGSTGKAALLEGFQFIGIERDPEYLAIAEARIRLAENNKPNLQQPELFDGL